MLAIPQHLFSTAGYNLPPPAESRAESVAFKRVFRELLDDDKRNNTPPWEIPFVCNSSSNNLTTVTHITHFAT